MTAASWKRVPLERVELRSLNGTQRLREEGVEAKLEEPELDSHIHVVCWHHRLWVADGHQRVAAAIIAGRSHLWARVVGVVDRR